jgi:Transcriptional regulator PadR-like family
MGHHAAPARTCTNNVEGVASYTLDEGRPPPCDWVVGTTVLEFNTQYAPSMMSSKPVMTVRLAILVLLSEGPKSGQQLCDELEARTGEVWPVNADQVYATLRRLERDGLVDSGGACEESPQDGIRITA